MPDYPTGGAGGLATIIAGRYEILQRTGEGALFTVARARDRQTGQIVAVKALKPAMARDVRFAARLLSEAHAARILEHPHIARVLDAGQDGSTVFVVTEFVSGVSLRDRIRRTAPLPVAVAVDIAVDVADALAYAHNQGLVHGDLRPNNVLITSDGVVKVTDFGVARALADSADLQPNSVLRWVQCMSPEVAEGRVPTTASDTYSLGCILYEMLTGTPAFPGDNAIVVALKHAKEPARPLRDTNSSISPALAAMVMRSIEKEPAARYATGAAMLEDLRRAQDALRYNKPLDYTPTQVLKPVTTPPPAPVYEDEDDVPRSLVIFRNILLTLVGVGFVLMVWFMYNLLQPQKDVIVPEVIGKTTQAAQEELQARGLQWNVLQRESRLPEGQVLNQEPEPNQPVKPGRNITLYVSKGPRVETVPNITEMSLDRARELAAQNHLAVKKGELKHDEVVQKGYVIDQIPTAGERVPPGKVIKVTVSLGPEPPPPPPPVEPEPTPMPAYDPNAPPPPTGMTPVTPEQRTGRVRSFNVSFQIPTKGYEEPVELQVVVIDERGENTVTDEQRRLGEFVTKHIDAVGEKVHIRVYLNGQLYSEEVK